MHKRDHLLGWSKGTHLLDASGAADGANLRLASTALAAASHLSWAATWRERAALLDNTCRVLLAAGEGPAAGATGPGLSEHDRAHDRLAAAALEAVQTPEDLRQVRLRTYIFKPVSRHYRMKGGGISSGQ